MGMAKAKARFWHLRQLWDSSAFPIATKVRLFGAALVSILVSILVYGSEAWLRDDKLEAVVATYLCNNEQYQSIPITTNTRCIEVCRRSVADRTRQSIFLYSLSQRLPILATFHLWEATMELRCLTRLCAIQTSLLRQIFASSYSTSSCLGTHHNWFTISSS